MTSSNSSNPFRICSNFEASKAQKIAISNIIQNIENKKHDQVLLGITGSGKTFVMANIIEQTGRPAIILAHNKTLVAQLYQEFKSFFPNNAVEYFVSYYDYYQPEAYVARTNSYIEKDSSINEQIDRLRHCATRSLLMRNDVIIIASVSAIYGLGDRDAYEASKIVLQKNQKINIRDLAFQLVCIQYENKAIDFKRGSFRICGDIVDIFPSHEEDNAYKVSFFDDLIESIWQFDSLTGRKICQLDCVSIFSNTHYATSKTDMKEIVKRIEFDLSEQVKFFKNQDRLVEAQRIKEKTEHDIEMLLQTRTCKGIENYSRYLTGRSAGNPPPTLFEYIAKNALLFIDESHAMIPQIGAMYNGDHSRKQNLINYGFRLPSALDNRPLKFEEWDAMRPQTIYVSATPAEYELNISCGPGSSFEERKQKSNCLTELLIRPTGLLDPVCEIRKTGGQIDDLMNEIRAMKKAGFVSMAVTLTKKMAEDLHEFFLENGIASEYLHSDVKTFKRIEIINQLRLRKIDVLIGVNLLREGLDIPECALVAIMDADKEGFLRSTTSLIQTIGRAARNSQGKVILYADKITNSMQKALFENERRRKIQLEYNKDHGITPKTIIKSMPNNSKIFRMDDLDLSSDLNAKLKKELELDKEFKNINAAIKFYSKKMHQLAKQLKFEEAKILRDKIKILERDALIED